MIIKSFTYCAVSKHVKKLQRNKLAGYLLEKLIAFDFLLHSQLSKNCIRSTSCYICHENMKRYTQSSLSISSGATPAGFASSYTVGR